MNRLVLVSAVVVVALVVSSLAYVALGPGGAGKSSTLSGTASSATSSGTGGSATGSGTTLAQNGQGCSPADWTTYHGNNSRSGHAPSPTSSAGADWVSPHLDGEVYAEPLSCGGRLMVATENDTVYSLNATSGAVEWRTHLGAPMQGSSLPCGDIDPSGITGTPVIDPASGLVYVVAFLTPGAHKLVGLNVADGTVRFSRSADPPGANPLVEQQRGALTLAGGRVYVPYGGLLGDCGDYHGWVVGLDADGTGGLISYQVQSQREAGIWAPSGAATDSSGDIFVATGNGASESQFDYGNSVIELSPALKQLGYFAPTNWQQLNQGDTDLGSFGPLLLADGEILQVGKEGTGYLLNASDLGGIGGQLYSSNVCGSAFGGGAESEGMAFVPCTDGLFAVATSPKSFQVAWHSPRFPAGPPIVTGGTVWTLDTSSGTLHGYDASTGAELHSFDAGQVTRFTTPSFGDGRIFVAAGTQVLAFLVG